MVHRLIATLLLPLAITSCGRSFRSCAAYIAILGPTTLTITCPPPGFVGTDTTPVNSTTLKEQPP
jgi:hypothetical protein